MHFHITRNLNLAYFFIALTDAHNLAVLSQQEIEEAYVREPPDEAKHLLKERAQEITAHLIWCKRQIAKELELDVDDVIFIPQRQFHIDFDLFITPTQKIALRSPLSAEEKILWAMQKQILEKHFPRAYFVDVPDQFSYPYHFCGLAIKETNSFMCTEDPFSDNFSFEAFLKDTCGFSDVIWVKEGKFFENCNAGLNCFAQEYFYRSTKK